MGFWDTMNYLDELSARSAAHSANAKAGETSNRVKELEKKVAAQQEMLDEILTMLKAMQPDTKKRGRSPKRN